MLQLKGLNVNNAANLNHKTQYQLITRYCVSWGTHSWRSLWDSTPEPSKFL